MAYVPIRRQRLNQPNGDGIDWNNPLTRGLVAAASKTGHDLLAKQTVIGAPASVPGKYGTTRVFSVNQGIIVDHGYKGAAYTLVALGPFTHRNESRQIIDEDDVGSNRCFQLRMTGHTLEFIPFDQSGGLVVLGFSTANLTLVGRTTPVVAVARAGNGKIKLDLTDCGSVSGTLPSHKPLTGQTVIGNFKGNYLSPNTDGITSYLIFNRYISDAEVKDLLSDYWQVFL